MEPDSRAAEKGCQRTLRGALNVGPQVLHHLTVFTSSRHCHCEHASAGGVCTPPIDVVYTWVNGSDAAFLRQMLQQKLLLERAEALALAVNASTTANSIASNGTARYDDIR